MQIWDAPTGNSAWPCDYGNKYFCARAGLTFSSRWFFYAPMTTRQKIGHILLFAMLAMQLAFAQHASVHVYEDISSPARHHQDDPSPDKDPFCQICLFAKNVSHFVVPIGPDMPIHALTAGTLLVFEIVPLCGRVFSHYSARAPPAAPV